MARLVSCKMRVEKFGVGGSGTVESGCWMSRKLENRSAKVDKIKAFSGPLCEFGLVSLAFLYAWYKG